MIEIISKLPDFTAGFHAEGKITRDDYEGIIVPTIREKLEHYSRINLIYDLGEHFEGYDFRTAWFDTMNGWKNFYRWHHIALVSDKFWVQNTVKFWSLCTPKYMKVFYQEEKDAAIDWVSKG